jgi:hypothetical protein
LKKIASITAAAFLLGALPGIAQVGQTPPNWRTPGKDPDGLGGGAADVDNRDGFGVKAYDVRPSRGDAGTVKTRRARAESRADQEEAKTKERATLPHERGR